MFFDDQFENIEDAQSVPGGLAVIAVMVEVNAPPPTPTYTRSRDVSENDRKFQIQMKFHKFLEILTKG